VPRSATIPEVVSLVLQDDFPGLVTNITVLKVRQVRIDNGSGRSKYLAVLVETSAGEKVVLMRYVNKQVTWQRVYDVHEPSQSFTKPAS
jgi:hypothetical protein